MRILITGAAGFIGAFLSNKLAELGCLVIGLDNLNNYYEVRLKEERLKKLDEKSNFAFIKGDISERTKLNDVFRECHPDVVIHLAAQAGVRYSIDNPDSYINSNVIGLYNILEACRKHPVEHLIYASSSSVYGHNKEVPFKETDITDYPVSLYAATKKSNELMAYTYSHLYGIPTSGLRFFTVYGPMGRPDMAYFKFTDLFFQGKPIHIYNDGNFENDMYRDFTYIDDIIEGIVKLIPVVPRRTTEKSAHEIYNIGNSNPVKLMDFILSLEEALSKSLGREIEFKKNYEAIKPGDVPATYASSSKLEKAVGYRPNTPLSEGLQEFTDWYVEFYNK